MISHLKIHAFIKEHGIIHETLDKENKNLTAI